jgi:CheY-like chemotaxis protein
MARPSNLQIGELVLLIEPDAVIRRSLLSWLRSAMPECTAAGGANMQEALALAQFKWPSVVVLDIADPDVDGA